MKWILLAKYANLTESYPIIYRNYTFFPKVNGWGKHTSKDIVKY